MQFAQDMIPTIYQSQEIQDWNYFLLPHGAWPTTILVLQKVL